MRRITQGHWSIACICALIGFMIAVQFRTTQDAKDSLSYQRVEEIADRLVRTERERDSLREELQELKAGLDGGAGEAAEKNDKHQELLNRAGLVPLIGEGVIVRMEDSARVAKAGENPNLYVIHDDDILRVINELRAAGAEAISINGQRLTDTSEIRCAGPTLSVNNVRSAAPFEISAIGDKKNLVNSLKMRGGVVDTLGVWGIQLEIIAGDHIYIPAYKGSIKQSYAKPTDEQQSTEENK